MKTNFKQFNWALLPVGIAAVALSSWVGWSYNQYQRDIASDLEVIQLADRLCEQERTIMACKLARQGGCRELEQLLMARLGESNFAVEQMVASFDPQSQPTAEVLRQVWAHHLTQQGFPPATGATMLTLGGQAPVASAK